MQTTELHMVHCPHCGDVKMFPAGDPRLSGRCNVCLNGPMKAVAVDFLLHKFVTPV